MNSINVFREIFFLIRKHVPKRKRKKIALVYWHRLFDEKIPPQHLSCDRTLLKLGLAEERHNATGEEYYVYWNPGKERWDEIV